MKAAVFYGKNDLRIEDIPKPSPGRGEALVRVMACGVCGTDVHIFGGDEGAAATPPGTVLGHEFAGIIEAIGEDVTRFSVGDHVDIDPNQLCNECYYCRSGLGHFCEHMTGIGTGVNGGFAEYCAVPVSQLYKVSDATPLRAAAMTEPLACCLHGADMSDIVQGENVLVIGGGMIGLIMLQLAKLRGAGKVVLAEPVESKRVLAKKLGADVCYDPTAEDARAVLEANGIRRVASVIECVGRKETMAQAIELAGNKSTVMLFGLTAPGDEIPIKPFSIFKKEITLRASYINPYTHSRALALIESGKVDVTSMVSEVVPLSELPAVLADGKRRSAGKIIVDPQAK